MSENIKEKVKKIVADHLGVDEQKVTEEASFIDDLGADSLDTVELVMAFEEEFGSEISDSEAEKILTVVTRSNLLRVSLAKKVKMPQDEENILLILSSPSGAGKLLSRKNSTKISKL